MPLLVVVNKVDPASDGGAPPDPVSTNGATGNNNTSNTAWNVKGGFVGLPVVSAEEAAEALGLETMPHSSMDVVCCSAAVGWGTQGILIKNFN